MRVRQTCLMSDWRAWVSHSRRARASERWPTNLTLEQLANLATDQSAGLSEPRMAAGLTIEQPADMTDEPLTDLTDKLK